MPTQRRPRAPALRLDAAVDEYLAWLELDRHRSPRTVTEYRADLRRFLEFAAAARVARTAAVDRDLIRAYQRRVSSQRHSPATRQRRLVALRSFLRFAALEEWTARDLALAIDLPKLPERLPKPLEDVERERLLEELPVATPAEKRDRALVLLLLSTGARISEILRLDRRDWARERLTVLGKGDKERVVTVTARARDAVDDTWQPGPTRRRRSSSPSIRGRAVTPRRAGPIGSPLAAPAMSAPRSPAGSASATCIPTGCGTPSAPSCRSSSATPA